MGNVNLRTSADALVGELVCTRAEIYQELNGEYSAEIECPLVDDVKPGQIVELVDRNGSVQKFRTLRPVEHLDGYLIRAEHITTDLGRDMILNRGWMESTGARVWPELLQAGVSERRFSGVSDVASVASMRIVRKSVWDAITGGAENTWLNRWGGELRRDNYTIDALARIGKVSAQEIEYGINLTGIEITEDESEIVNRVVATALVGQYGVLSLPEQYIDADNINETPVPHMAHIHYGDIRVGEADEDGHIAYPTNADAYREMRRRVADIYASGGSRPKLTVRVSFVDLAATEEFKDVRDLMALDLGDTVTARYKGREIRQRIVAYKWDALREEYIDITLGDVRPSLDARLARISTEILAEAEYQGAARYSSIARYINRLNDEVAQAVGMYRTERTLETGGTAVYFHDAPTLEESQLIEYYPEPGTRVWTAGGWNNGAPVWQYGRTSSGMLVMRLIATEGIEAEWIRLESGETLAAELQRMHEAIEAEVTWGDYPVPPYKRGQVWHQPSQTWGDIEARGWTWGDIEARNLQWDDIEGGYTYVCETSRATGILNRNDWRIIKPDTREIEGLTRRISDTESELTSAQLTLRDQGYLISSNGSLVEKLEQHVSEISARKISMSELTPVDTGSMMLNRSVELTVDNLLFRHANGSVSTYGLDGAQLTDEFGVTSYLSRVKAVTFTGDGARPVRLETPPEFRAKPYFCVVMGADSGNAPADGQTHYRAGRSYYGLCPPQLIPDGGPEYNNERVYVMAYQEWIDDRTNARTRDGLVPAQGVIIFIA